MTSTDATSKVETPFTTAALDTDVAFWESYIASRPSPSEDFFELINSYHAAHSPGAAQSIAHDVGTGPGNIARRLAGYYQRVVGSDVNGSALAAASALVPASYEPGKMTFVKSAAEELSARDVVPADVGVGKTDLVVVSECMPLLDPVKALSSFHSLLQPGGTLAIYFYGRPVFVDDGDNGAQCNTLYERAATRICKFLWPMKGTPGFPFQKRGAEGLVSSLDNVALPAEHWSAVERRKWNCKEYALLFNGLDGWDFDFQPLDRRCPGEKNEEIVDPGFWTHHWSVDHIRGYLDSVFPNHRARAGEQYAEVESIFDELSTAMGGSKRKVTFPVVLILATRK